MAMVVQGPRRTRKHKNLLVFSVHCFNKRFLVLKRLLSLHQKLNTLNQPFNKFNSFRAHQRLERLRKVSPPLSQQFSYNSVSCMRSKRVKTRLSISSYVSHISLSFLSYQLSSVLTHPVHFFFSLVPCHVKLLRLFRLLKYHSVDLFFVMSDYRTSKPYRLRAFKLILYLSVAMHWVACLYYTISEYEGLGTNDWVYTETKTGGDHFAR